MKQTMIDIYKKDMSGYSSENAYKYLSNKGVEEGEKYYIDKYHYFIPYARKGEVWIELYYLGKMIDIDAYMKRYRYI